MKLSQLDGLELEIGYGKNLFSMKHGNYRCRQKLIVRRKLVRSGREETDEGFCLIFTEEITDKHHLLYVSKRGDQITIRYDCPDDTVSNRYWISLPTHPSECFFGCGEGYIKLNLRGEVVRIWNASRRSVRRVSWKRRWEKFRGARPMRTLPFEKYESSYTQPTFISSSEYFVHVDTARYAEFDFTRPGRTVLHLQEAPKITIGRANDYAALSMQLSSLLGRPCPMPQWIYDGSFLTSTVDLSILKRHLHFLKKADVPIRAIWCPNWCGNVCTQGEQSILWNWEYDQLLYPDLPNEIRAWRAKDIRFLGYINPFLSVGGNLYEEASSKHYCVKRKNGKDYLLTVVGNLAAMVDFTNPDARVWFKNIIRDRMIGIGMSGWMADFGEYLPPDSVLYSGEKPEDIHNLWPSIWAELNREVIAESGREDEIFFFMRSGHTESIASSALLWTGVQSVDWSVDDGLPSVIPASLSLSLSGCCLSFSDIDIYSNGLPARRRREVWMRWAEMNVFSLLFRCDITSSIPNFSFRQKDDKVLIRHMIRCSRMHAALRDYLKESAMEASLHGIPLIRPLFYHYDDGYVDEAQDEYLLGRDILVAPVLREGECRRLCYLPKDRWVHLYSDQIYTGTRIMIDAPIGETPVFLRRDSAWFDSLFRDLRAAAEAPLMVT